MTQIHLAWPLFLLSYWWINDTTFQVVANVFFIADVISNFSHHVKLMSVSINIWFAVSGIEKFHSILTNLPFCRVHFFPSNMNGTGWNIEVMSTLKWSEFFLYIVRNVGLLSFSYANYSHVIDLFIRVRTMGTYQLHCRKTWLWAYIV